MGIFSTQSRTGARHPGIPYSSSARRSRGAAGAVALRLEFVMATEWSVTARRAGQEFRRAPSRGPMVPGLRYRRRANGSIVLSHAWPIRGLIPGCRTRRIPNLPSQAHPGLTCLGTGETVSPTRTLLTLPPTTRTVPDPAPVRAGGQYGAEGYQADTQGTGSRLSSFDFAQDESVYVRRQRSAHAERRRSTGAG